MADTKKFLDLDGVKTLWGAIEAADNKVLESVTELSDSIASKGASIKYDSATGFVQLCDSKSNVISEFDAKAFITDGMLESVEVVDATPENPILDATTGTFIKFTWNADGQETTYLEASKIGKIYTGSDSIDIDSSNAISVKEVDADITKTTRAMTVSSAIGDYKADTVIPEGTDIMAILANIFEKTLGVTKTNPSVSLSLQEGTNTNATIEYGTQVESTWKATFNPGSYKGDGWAANTVTDVDPTEYIWTGVSSTLDTATFAGVLTENTSISVQVKYTDGNMPVDNKGNELPDSQIKASTTSKATKTYTVAKKWWVGFSNDLYENTTWDSDMVRALSLYDGFVTTKNASVTFPKGAKQQVIAVPAGTNWSAKDGQQNDMTGQFKTDDAPKQTVSVKCGEKTVDYDIYVAPANAGLEGDANATITLN